MEVYGLNKRYKYNPEYYKTAEWRYISTIAKQRDEYLCPCGDKGTECHHKSYHNFGKSNWFELQDLVTLCGNCHRKESKRLGHGKYKTTKIKTVDEYLDEYFKNYA